MSNLQLELLKLYATDIADEQLLEIKKLLARYFAQQIDEEMNRIWEERNYSDATIEEWKHSHQRTPYQ
jgi:hypothetical protein